MDKKITIGYLYPEYMNIYGDTGNIVALQYRAKKRGIAVELRPISIGTRVEKNEIDIYFFGGGQDQQQVYVSEDIQRLSEVINQDIESGAVALTVCGGYQLFGEFYRPFDQKDLKGVTIFPVQTHASNVRMIGNCVIKMHDQLYSEIQNIYSGETRVPPTLIGFENHSGQTNFVETVFTNAKPIGDTLYGFGNNETKKNEGCWRNNAFGTYLHGSLLPKNPHFADYLLYKALEYRYERAEKLSILDDSLEYNAHAYIAKKYANLVK